MRVMLQTNLSDGETSDAPNELSDGDTSDAPKEPEKNCWPSSNIIYIRVTLMNGPHTKFQASQAMAEAPQCQPWFQEHQNSAHSRTAPPLDCPSPVHSILTLRRLD